MPRKVEDSGNNVLFVAICRILDKVIVGSYISDPQDYKKESYLSQVRDVVSAPGFASKVSPGSRYRLAGESDAITFITDTDRVYLVVTATDYPERLAFPLLNEIRDKFMEAQLDGRSQTCKEFAISGKVKKFAKTIVDDYDDPASIDKLSAVQAKVDDVKVTMHNNISGMLRNMDKTEQIERDTDDLENQSRMFHKQANDLKTREQWKSWKLTILIAAILIIIITIMVFSLMKQ